MADEALKLVKERTRLCDAYRELFDNPQNLAGKMVLRDLGKKFFQMKPSKIIVAGDVQATGFHLGQRSVVDYILNQVTTDMEKIIKHMKEQRENEH